MPALRREARLYRHPAAFDLRYSNHARLGVSDAQRAEKALKGIVGKRLTHRRTDKPPENPSPG